MNLFVGTDSAASLVLAARGTAVARPTARLSIVHPGNCHTTPCAEKVPHPHAAFPAGSRGCADQASRLWQAAAGQGTRGARSDRDAQLPAWRGVPRIPRQKGGARGARRPACDTYMDPPGNRAQCREATPGLLVLRHLVGARLPARAQARLHLCRVATSISWMHSLRLLPSAKGSIHPERVRPLARIRPRA